MDNLKKSDGGDAMRDRQWPFAQWRDARAPRIASVATMPEGLRARTQGRGAAAGACAPHVPQ